MKKFMSAALAAAMLLGASPATFAQTPDASPAVQTEQTAIDPFDSAYSIIKNVSTGRAIAVENKGKENLDKIVTELVDENRTDDNTLWRISPIGGDMYCAVNKNSGRSLDVPDALKEDGVQLIQYSYNGNAQQKMTFERVAGADAYTIKPSHADTYLADWDGKLVQIQDKNAKEAQ